MNKQLDIIKAAWVKQNSSRTAGWLRCLLSAIPSETAQIAYQLRNKIDSLSQMQIPKEKRKKKKDNILLLAKKKNKRHKHTKFIHLFTSREWANHILQALGLK